MEETRVCPCGKEFVTRRTWGKYCSGSHRTKAYMLRRSQRERLKKEKKEQGQSLVEFSISLVVILFLLVGIVEFGIMFFQFVQLRDAAQEGALFGSACPDPVLIEERVRGSSNTPLDLSDTTKVFVDIYLADPAGNPKDLGNVKEADAMTVKASYSHKIFMPFLARLIGRGNVPIVGSVTDTVLRDTCQ